MTALRIVDNGQTPSDQQPTENLGTFDTFWALYPKRVAKKDAERAWNRVDKADYGELFTALMGWRRVWAARGELQYTPNPASWLNGERWTDELPPGAAVKPPKIQQATDDGKPAEQFVRGEIPEHIRAAINKALKR